MRVQRVIPQVHLKQVNVIQIVHLIQILSFHLIVQAAKILSYYYTCMVFLSGSESLHFFFFVLLYICIAVGDPVQEGNVGIPSPHFCTCLKPGIGFPISYVMGFLNISEWVKMRGNCSFVDFGEIGESHCLINFLFIIERNIIHFD